MNKIYYRGIQALSVPGLHEAVVRTATEYVWEGQSILDVGCGHGALALRLFDEGYQHIDAIDLLPNEEINPAVATYYSIDLNTVDWPEKIPTKYDLVICSEVAEHLENTRQLVRNLAKVTRPGGHIIITTPNLEQPISKLHFLKSGRFYLFFDSDESQSNHISPISEREMKSCLRAAHLKLVKIKRGGNFPLIRINIDRLVDSVLWSMLSLLTFWSRNRSLCKIYVARKRIYGGQL